jgi:hypothetical protein
LVGPIVIKPVAVYEDLPKDEIKERIRSEIRKTSWYSCYFNLVR